MRKLLIGFFIAVPVLICVFAIGALIAIGLNWGKPIATVLVKNETDQEITSVTISYTTCGIKRKLSYEASEQDPEKGVSQEVTMRLVLCGEGGQRIEVVLGNGQMFSSKGAYLEGGYELTEHITNEGIKTEYTGFFQ